MLYFSENDVVNDENAGGVGRNNDSVWDDDDIGLGFC